MMNCPACHAPVLPGAVFCDNCGIKLPQLHQPSDQAAPSGTQCPGCGAESLPGDVFCSSCGMLLPSVTAQPPRSQVGNTAADLSQPRVSANASSRGTAAAPITGITGRFVVSGTNDTFDFPNDKPELLVGRAEPETRYFPDIDTTRAGGAAAGVSRRHARLTAAGGRVYIEDLGSTNFTFVNRQRLQLGQRVPLNPGDEVRLGRLVMVYYT